MVQLLELIELIQERGFVFLGKLLDLKVRLEITDPVGNHCSFRFCY